MVGAVYTITAAGHVDAWHWLRVMYVLLAALLRGLGF
jgi:hypothetical protein